MVVNIPRSSGLLTFTQISTSIIGFLGITYFTRELGTSVIGAYFLIQALSAVLGLPADLGIRTAIEKRVSEKQSPGKSISSGIVLKIIPLSIVGLFIIIFSSRLNTYLGGEYSLLLLLVLILREMSSLTIHILRGEHEISTSAVIKLFQQILWILFSVLFINMGMGLKGLIYGICIGYSSTILLGCSKIHTRPYLPSVEYARNIIEFSIPGFVAGLGGQVHNWLDILIIGVFLAQSDVGIYELAWRLTGFTLIFSQSLGTTVFPQFSTWHTKNDYDKISSTFENILDISTVFVIPSLIGLAIIGEYIFPIVFDTNHPDALIVLIILMIQRVIFAPGVLFSQILTGFDRPELVAYSKGISIITNIVLNIVLILSLGLVGAAIATGISFVINIVIQVYYVYQLIDIDIRYSKTTWYLFSSIIMGMLIQVIEFIFDIDSIIDLSICILLGIVVYSSLILFNNDTRIFILKIFNLT